MDNIKIIANRLRTSIDIKEHLLEQAEFLQLINTIAEEIVNCFKNGNKLWFCGNGGSAADAQHLAAEFSGRYYYDRQPLPAEALHVNTSYITAVANDYGYNEIYSRWIKAFGQKNDILIGLTTSGKSKNVIKALEEAKRNGLKTIAFTGQHIADLQHCTNYIISVPSEDTPRVQEIHILIGHIICELVEKTLFPQNSVDINEKKI